MKSVEVNIDYILMLVDKFHGENIADKEIEIRKAIDSSPSLRNKKDLILDFISKLTIDSTVTDEWQLYIENKKNNELAKIIQDENLNEDETKTFIVEAFRNGEIREIGTNIVSILPPISMFGNDRSKIKRK